MLSTFNGRQCEYLYDSVVTTAIPGGVKVIAGYVDGDWPNYEQMKQTHPQAYVVPITVTGKAGVRAVDVERGNLTPEQGAKWAANELKAGRRPTIYSSLSNVQEIISNLAKLRIHESAVDFWVAAWLTVNRQASDLATHPGQCGYSNAVAWQFASDVPHNESSYDLSVTNGVWPYPKLNP